MNDIKELVSSLIDDLENKIDHIYDTKKVIVSSGDIRLEGEDQRAFFALDFAATGISKIKRDLMTSIDEFVGFDFVAVDDEPEEPIVSVESDDQDFFAKRHDVMEKAIDKWFGGSIAKAAKTAGVSPDTIKRVMNNENVGRESTLEKISDAFDIPFNKLQP